VHDSLKVITTVSFLTRKLSWLAVILGWAFGEIGYSQNFQAFLNRVYSVPIEAKAAIVDSFLAVQESFPVIEKDSIVYFIYTGEASSVTIPSDANQWDTNVDRMSRIYGTNLWYLTKQFEPDARLDYKFVINSSNWILDPRNPNTCLGGFGPNSELRMPAYRFPTEINYRPDIPHGTFFDTTFYSRNLQNSRQIRVYLPPGYPQISDSFGVVIFHDGLEFVNLAFANNVLDYLFWQKSIEPIIAIFIPPVNRTAEYAGNLRGKFTDFIGTEVLPWIFKKYPIYTNPAWHVTIGASNGGNISLWLAVSHPEWFGKVAAFSSNVQTDISSLLATSPKLPVQFYLDLGTYDIALLIPLVRNFKSLLDERGYSITYHEWHEGHSWGNWRAHVDEVLKLFFGKANEVESNKNPVVSDWRVSHYPNPFNSRVTFNIALPAPGRIILRVYNLQGREVANISSQAVQPGTYQIEWRPQTLGSGLYFYQITYGNLRWNGKLLYLR